MDPRQSTQGSYGFALKAMAEGLALAVEQGWVTKTEAKREYRSIVRTVQQDKQVSSRLMELQEEMDELTSQLNDTNDS